jgi:ATP adenylyltransferase
LDCAFCVRIDRGQHFAQNDQAVPFLDEFPLTPGHSLIVPRRHEPDFLSLAPVEQSAIWELLPSVRSFIENTHRPSGYNIGINIGETAGQTVAHAHIHVIPRYPGDVPDPRGGICGVIPTKARYWEST